MLKRITEWLGSRDSTPFLVVGVFALSACNMREEKLSGIPSPVIASSLFDKINKTIIQPKCLSCHSGANAAASVDLSSYAVMMQANLVVPMNPDGSRFYISVVSKRMPKGAPALVSDELELISTWISEGAREQDAQTQGPAPTSVPAENKVSYQWIAKNILQTRCVICHNTTKPRAKVDLSSYSAMMGSVGNKTKPVISGEPEKSTLFTEVAEQKMPPTIKALSPAEQQALQDWIGDGALTSGQPLPAPAPGPQPDPGPPQAKYEWLMANVFKGRCASCHGAPFFAAKVDFTNYNSLLDSPGRTIKALVPKDPEGSGIFKEVVEGAMPPKPKFLSAEEIEIVGQWIKEGAKNN